MKKRIHRVEYDSSVSAVERVTLVIRSTLFLFGQILLTIAFTPIGLAICTLPYRIRYRVLVRWAFLNIWWLGRTCKLRHEVQGLENVPQRVGIVLCKHESAWETLVLPAYFSPQTWVSKQELLCIPFFGCGLGMLQTIGINRASGLHALKHVLIQGRKALTKGLWVVVFPEGTRVAPGKRHRFRPGGAALAEATGRQVVPVAHNTGDYWPRRSFLKRPGTIRLVIGEPIDSKGRSAAEINSCAAEWIEPTVQALRNHGIAPE